MVPMHPNTRRDLLKYLKFLAKYGEDRTYRLIRHEMAKRYGKHSGKEE